MSTAAYVSSLSAIAESEGVLERVEAEFSAVVRAIDSNEDLRSKLTDELIPIAVRQQIVEKLLEGKGHRLTTQFVSLLLGAGKGRDLRDIAANISENVAGSSGRKVAEVRSAVELSEDQQKRLADALGKKFNTQVNLKVVVDPTVVGGIVATVGDEVIDASVRSKLDQLKSRL